MDIPPSRCAMLVYPSSMSSYAALSDLDSLPNAFSGSLKVLFFLSDTTSVSILPPNWHATMILLFSSPKIRLASSPKFGFLSVAFMAIAATATFLIWSMSDFPSTFLYRGMFTLGSMWYLLYWYSGLTSTMTALFSLTKVRASSTGKLSSPKLVSEMCTAGHTVYATPVLGFICVKPPSFQSERGNPRLSSLTQRKLAPSQ
mmetsp:Transcript_6065/g.11112  ORF Transcript_6065/g.11112 Transcript_6065/m.11112 type:complete len:201 (+) Transcript_6065:110-712(+)|eukprot:CAMPEP_0197477006 /NCGR_PEP_ID=MMETSP1309-20131121/12503_1 /TAXON_ID=464262 /ORGANISM="Genus nov. species nov., Strain RCC998" /LENGTH=200 /DNA_ID=CAMNT_0043017679 /DNA_START=94 /DNA_END=696 /DNA_ORIENTATION=+